MLTNSNRLIVFHFSSYQHINLHRPALSRRDTAGQQRPPVMHEVDTHHIARSANKAQLNNLINTNTTRSSNCQNPVYSVPSQPCVVKFRYCTAES